MDINIIFCCKNNYVEEKDGDLTENMSDKQVVKDNIRRELSDKAKVSSKMSDKLSDIVVLAISNEYITTTMVVSRIISDTLEAGYIKPADLETQSKKYMTYIPYYA